MLPSFESQGGSAERRTHEPSPRAEPEPDPASTLVCARTSDAMRIRGRGDRQTPAAPWWVGVAQDARTMTRSQWSAALCSTAGCARCSALTGFRLDRALAQEEARDAEDDSHGDALAACTTLSGLSTEPHPDLSEVWQIPVDHDRHRNSGVRGVQGRVRG